MSTTKQINANHLNAKKSTGPRSAAGKAKVSLNSLQHGLLAKAALLPSENEDDFQTFADGLLDELQPVGALESLLAEEIVNLGWRLQRASQVEAGLFERERSFADEEWFREQERKWVVTEGQIAAETLRRSLGVPDPDKVAVVLDEEIHDNIVCLMDEAIDRRKSEVARLGDAFARDAAQGNAFSKIGRYETGIDRRLSRKLQELAALQEARRAGAQA
jgi:hypothetical protein